MDEIVVDARQVGRVYVGGGRRVTAIEAVTLQVSAGDAVAVVGGSGAGKTTLLNLIGGLDRPTAGRVEVLGHDLGSMTEGPLVESPHVLRPRARPGFHRW